MTPQPIETAPRDRRILVWSPLANRWIGAYWADDRYNRKPIPFWKLDGWLQKTEMRLSPPTHWMELPPAPEEAK